MIFTLSVAFLSAILVGFLYFGKTWSTTPTNFLFANRSLKAVSTGLAINSHWFWAIAMFVAPAVAYNWGIVGLLWFVIPNSLSLLVVAALTHKLRDVYPDGYSLTEYIKDNFSKRMGILYQVVYAGVALMGLLLAFTAITKFFAFAGLGEVIDPIYASLIVGLITLGFTIKGGIRTSVYTGVIQTVLWVTFLGAMFVAAVVGGFDFSVFGKNNLHTVFDDKFLTTFGIAYIITIMVGATTHGTMWQKSFSMPKEEIFPSYTLAAVIFAFVVFSLGSFGLYAQSIGLEVKAPDLSSLAGILNMYGVVAITVFGVLLIGQTSTVMDSQLNYISSLVSREWIKGGGTTTARIVMAVFFIAAWMISWLKVEVWTIFMLMGSLRISMFAPLVFTVYQRRLNEILTFYISLISISGCLYFSYTGKILKDPVYDMYSALYGLGLPLAACLISTAIAKKNDKDLIKV